MPIYNVNIYNWKNISNMHLGECNEYDEYDENDEDDENYIKMPFFGTVSSLLNIDPSRAPDKRDPGCCGFIIAFFGGVSYFIGGIVLCVTCPIWCWGLLCVEDQTLKKKGKGGIYDKWRSKKSSKQNNLERGTHQNTGPTGKGNHQIEIKAKGNENNNTFHTQQKNNQYLPVHSSPQFPHIIPPQKQMVHPHMNLHNGQQFPRHSIHLPPKRFPNTYT